MPQDPAKLRVLSPSRALGCRKRRHPRDHVSGPLCCPLHGRARCGRVAGSVQLRVGRRCSELGGVASQSGEFPSYRPFSGGWICRLSPVNVLL